MSTLALSVRQARYELKAFFRNPAAAFFTFVFPLMFLVIFNMVFGNTEITAADGATYPFHSTVIADGSRTIAVGTAVEFEVTAGHLGRWEASEVVVT